MDLLKQIAGILISGNKGKTYGLAALLAMMFWLKMIGVVPDEVYAEASKWIAGLLTYTVGLRVVNPK